MATILVCVDKSDIAEKAFRWYIAKFHKSENTVVLCHVPEFWGDVARSMSPAKIDECIAQTNDDIKKLEQKYEVICREVEVESTLHCPKGKHVWHEICEYAKKIDASTVVIGTRGMGTLKRTVLGSVSDAVLHHCHIPVLIYKQ